MGQTHSLDPVHVRMYANLIQINDPAKRIQIIHTCMASMEYMQSAKRAGVYSYLLNYISTVQNGGQAPLLPGESEATRQAAYAASSDTPRPKQPYQQEIAVPRSLQNMNMHGPGATHPSLVGKEKQLTIRQESVPAWKTVTETPKQKIKVAKGA